MDSSQEHQASSSAPSTAQVEPSNKVPSSGGNPLGGNPNFGTDSSSTSSTHVNPTLTPNTPSLTTAGRAGRSANSSPRPPPAGSSLPPSSLHPSLGGRTTTSVSLGTLLQSEAETVSPSLYRHEPSSTANLLSAANMSLNGSSPSRPPSRAPRSRVHTPRSLTPANGAGVGGARSNSASLAGGGDRPLNVADALGYLDAVKIQFQDKPDVYNRFLDIMKDFKGQVIDTPGVIDRVSMLFRGNPVLIQGFNTFLPPGYRIEVSQDPSTRDTIMVTTPSGVTAQPFNAFGQPVRMRENGVGLSSHSHSGMSTPMYPAHPAFGGGAPPPILPVGLGPGSRPASPLGHPPPMSQSVERPIHPNPFHMPPEVSHPYSPAMQGAQAQNAAATVLGGMGNNRTVERTAAEFNHAIQFLNKIKIRYSDDTEVYKQFLEILQQYQKEQKQLHDSQVFAQVSRLFKDAPELMEEFKDFLPDIIGPSAQQGSGLVGIMPHPSAAMPSNGWDAPDAAPTAPVKAPSRRRKREKEAPPQPSSQAPGKATGSRGNKKAKLAHSKGDNAPSPQFSPYPLPPSPEPAYPPIHGRHPAHPSQQSQGLHFHQQFVAPPAYPGGPSSLSSQEELMFFDRTKKALESSGSYEEFLKLLNLFAKDVIDTRTLIKRSEVFLTDSELLFQFKELMGWDDKRGHSEHGPPNSIRTGPPDPAAATCPDDDEGPSYRRLPSHETRLACSGRDQLAWSVLNDEWVSHPTWASEEAGFLTHKKNSFEETLHRSEEERHEYQVHIDAITRTIAVLDPLDARIEEMSPEERAQFKLGSDLGGWTPAVYQKIVKKVYGRDAGQEVYRALQEYPSVAVPVVLARLKQKSEEWRRLQREWNRTWREVDAKNFYKALDHQGITFKANDKKNITARYFVQDIETIKAAQLAERDGRGEVTSWPGFQLEYDLEDMDVLQDSLKLIYGFLDNSASQYSSSERRSIEQFLRTFIPALFSFSQQEFNAACGPSQPFIEDHPMHESEDHIDEGARSVRSGRRSAAGTQSSGVPAGDLRKRLLKTVQEGTPSRAAVNTKQSNSAGTESPTEKNSPIAKATGSVSDETTKRKGSDNDRSNTDNMWISGIPYVPQSQGSTPVEAGETPAKKRPFFAGTTFYTLLRLLQLLYSRLLTCKRIGAQMAREKHASLRANPVAVELGLDEPNGPSVLLEQAIEAVGESAGDEPNVLYLYLLDACEKVFANELDQSTFEEHMRWFFRTQAYHIFTLDKVITAIIKQVQTIHGDNKCQELWHLLQDLRKQDDLTLYDIIRYRREAERHVGADDHLYRVDCDRDTKTMRIQLLGADDPSADEDSTSIGRWREYTATYISRHPTEWLPRRTKKARHGPLYLKRNLIDEENTWNGTEMETSKLCVRVSLGTYKLFYGAGTEDVFVRQRTSQREATLRTRALVRAEERRRSRWLE